MLTQYPAAHALLLTCQPRAGSLCHLRLRLFLADVVDHAIFTNRFHAAVDIRVGSTRRVTG